MPRSKIKIAAFLVLIMAMLCNPLLLRATITYSYSIDETDLNIYDVSAPDGTIFSRISGLDMFGSGEVGHPEIPYKVIRFLVPDNAYDFSVKIVEMKDLSTIELGNKIYPNQQPVSINDYTDEMFTYADEGAYENTSGTFRAEVLDESRLEGTYHIVSVGLWPLAYSGVKDKLEICKTLRIQLDYKENGLFKQKRATSNNSGFINISDIVVNADMMGMDIATASDFSGDVPVSQIKLPYYYIISERSLIPALEDFATWKTQKGYRVVTKAIEDIYADSNYKVGANGIVDEAASLRKYLQDEYAKHGTFFCLLVGDHRTRMPIRKVYFNERRLTSEDTNGDKYVPTDNYFSDLSKDGWNLRYDSKGLYLTDVSTSYQPYIYIGRLLCSKPQEIKNYFSKLVLYETNPGRGNSDYLDNTTLTVMYDGRKSYKSILTEMNKIFRNVECLLDCKISDIYSKGYPSGNLMLQKLNESGFCSWTGHGEPSTVACSGMKYDSEYPTATGSDKWEYVKALTSYIYDSDPKKRQTNIKHICYDNGIDQLTNYDSPSFVYTTSCTTCPFDIYKSDDVTFDLPHTIASSYTVGGRYGGVAYLGNTRNGYFGSSEKLEVLFLKKVKENPKVGIAESISKNSYTVYDIIDQHVRHTHNLIGDPEFELWMCKPIKRNVYVSWNDKDISVHGDDVVGSTVVINNGEGYVRRLDVKQSLAIGYPGGGKMEAVGVYKTGYLPMVKLNCYDDQLENCTKKFVVRNAELGCTDLSSVSIGSGAEVDIRAVDSIDGGIGLEVSDSGKLTLRCDKSISLMGSKVSSGGNLSVKGEKVVLSKGFAVKAGGSLSINNN